MGKSHIDQHPLGAVWRGMLVRCHDPRSDDFENYGARGISVCPAWRVSFWQFVADMPPRPSRQHSIDRINNNGNYEPGNVRWATPTEQGRNTRFNRILTARGEQLTLAEWSELTGIPKSTLFNRIKRGWSDEATVTTPIQSKAADNALFPPGGRVRCLELGLNPFTVASRLRRGWAFERAITEPIARKHASR